MPKLSDNLTCVVVPRYAVYLLFVVYFRRQILMSGYQSGNMAGEMWVQWFSCCINQPAAQRVSHLLKTQLHFILLTTMTTCSSLFPPNQFVHVCYHIYCHPLFPVGAVASANHFRWICQFNTCTYLRILFLMCC